MSAGLLFCLATLPAFQMTDDPLPPGAIARIGSTRFRQGGMVRHVVFTRDGKRLVSMSEQRLAVWDAATGNATFFSAGEPRGISSDGSLCALVCGSHGLCIHESVSGKKRFTLLGHKEWIVHAVFSGDNRWLVSTDKNENILLWDLATGKLVHRWTGDKEHGAYYQSTTNFDPAGKTVIHASGFGLLLVWDVATGKEIFRDGPPQPDAKICLPVATDGDLYAKFVYGGDVVKIAVRSIKRNKTVATFKAVAGLTKGEFSSYSRTMAVHCYHERAIEVWDPEKGRQINKFKDPDGVASLLFAPDGKRIILGTNVGTIVIRDIMPGGAERRLRPSAPYMPLALALSPDEKTLACAGDDGGIHLWDLASGTERFPPTLEQLGGVSAWFLPDGKTIATRCHRDPEFGQLESRHIFLWDMQGKTIGKRSIDVGIHQAGCQLAPDGVTAAWFGSDDNKLYLRDLGTGKNLAAIVRGNDDRRCQFSPDSGFLIIHSKPADRERREYDAEIWKRGGKTFERVGTRLRMEGPTFFEQAPRSQWFCVGYENRWDYHRMETGRLMRTLPGRQGRIAAASPSGRLIVVTHPLTYDSEGWAKHASFLVEQATGRTVRKLDCDLIDLGFAPDGRHLIASARTGDVHFWDALSGKRTATLNGNGYLCSLSFSSDRRHLVTGSSDTTALVWDYRKMLPAPTLMRHSAEKLEKLWLDLNADDAGRGYRAVAALVQAPDQAIAFLQKKMASIGDDEAARLQKCIADLGSASFPARQRAELGVIKSGFLAGPMLEATLRQGPALEVRRRIEAILEKTPAAAPTGDDLAIMRAIDAVEMIATADAKRLLTAWSKRSPILLRDEAILALQRLNPS